MGGRGQRASRRAAGGSKKINIISTKDLISERERNREAVDAVLVTLENLSKEYGEQVNDLFLSALDKRNKDVMGYSGGDNVGINEIYFNANMLNDTFDKDNGYYHPLRGDKTGLQAVLAHEMGHVLTQRAATKTGNIFTSNMDSMSDAIVKEARKMTNHRGVVIMAKRISEYASSANAEAVAESVADVYCNGNRAKAESKAIVSVLKRYLKEGK